MIFRVGLKLTAVGGICLALAACGSSTSSSSTASSTSGSAVASASGSSSLRARATALRACLKAHGVTLPARRPGTRRPNGGTPGFFFGAGGGGGGFANNPKLRAAFQACGGGRGFGAGARRRLSQQAVNAFVACVRKHGFNLPSPNFKSGSIFPANIRSNPKFVTASRACAYLLVRPAGSGSPPAAGGGTPPSA